jgi:hypothetical protein
MRTKTFFQNGAGSTPWTRMNDKVANFDVSYAVYHAQGSDAAGSVDIGMSSDMVDSFISVNLTRSGTTVTVPNLIAPGQTLSSIAQSKTGDSIVVSGAGAPFDGTYAITNTAGVVTYTCANSGPTTGLATRIQLIRVSSIAFTGTDVPPTAFTAPFDFIRATVATQTTGTGIIFVVDQGTR